MKITDRNTVMPPLQVDRGKSTGPAHRASSTASADRVSLSPEAQKMQQDTMERVEEIKQQIRDGHYAVDLERLAHAILRKEFGG